MTQSYSITLLPIDIWYVNVDGKEGWVPSDTVRLMGENELESSRESTPGDPCISADNSELSDDGEWSGLQLGWIPIFLRGF